VHPSTIAFFADALYFDFWMSDYFCWSSTDRVPHWTLYIQPTQNPIRPQMFLGIGFALAEETLAWHQPV